MKIVLGPVVGGVTDNKAKVWIFWSRNEENEEAPKCHVFADEACTEEICQTQFAAISDSVHDCDSIQGLAGLANINFPAGGAKYYFKIRSSSTNDLESDRLYSIRPYPASGEIDSLSFALISCHRPFFNSQKDGKNMTPMWKRLNNEMHNHHSRFLIQAGDQVYCDKGLNAWKLSMREDSPQKMLWYYRQIYYHSWNFPEIQEVMTTFPQYMIWDDHEITNGWGSDKKNSHDAKQQRVFQIASQAYFEFQQSHNPDPLREGKFYFTFNYDSVAFLVMDLRGHRNITLYDKNKANDVYPLAGKEQWEDIEAWLNSKKIQESRMLFVVTSVPVCHLSRKFGSLGIFKNDIRDQWSTEHNKRERRKLLDWLYNWSGADKKPVFILGGDVHVGTVAKISEKETGKIIHQITSSPITNKPSGCLDYFLAKWSGKFDFHLEDNKKRPVHGEIFRRYRKRNFAIINIKFREEKPEVELLMYEQNKSKPDRVSLNC